MPDTHDAFLGGDDTQNAEAPPRFDATAPGALLFGDGTTLRGEVGTVLADRYRLESELGRGGMGSVWRATHLALDSPVAVKLIDPRLAGTEAARARFIQEARAAAALRSPNVVQVMDHGVDGGVPFIVMELLSGEPLSTRLQGGPISSAALLEIVDDVARALDRAHEHGIVHRDLKPDNIFLVRDGDREIAKVLDFGIAKVSDDGPGDTPTQTGTMLGTPHYMSPEQAEDTKAADFRTDLWALGVIVYQALMGRRPFEGDTITRVIIQICMAEIPVPSAQPEAPRLPVAFDRWFARACHRDRESRFESASASVRALREALAGPPAAMVASTPIAASPAARRWVVPAAAASVAIGGLGAFLMWSPGEVAAPEAAQAIASAPATTPVAAPTEITDPSAPNPDADEPATDSVRLTVEASPPGATVKLGDEVLGLAPGPFDIPRGTERLSVTVELEGYAPHTVEVMPDGNHTVSVSLNAKRTAAPRGKVEASAQPSTVGVRVKSKRRAKRKSGGKEEPLLEF